MKFLIIGDLHGNNPKVHFKDFDAVIAPGDFCSDALRVYMFEAIRKNLADAKSKVQWYDLTGKRKAKEMMQRSIADGRKILEFLNTLEVPVYAVPGNWDWTPEKRASWRELRKDHWKELTKGLDYVVDVHHKRVDAGEVEIIGHGIISGPEYPQYKEDKQRVTPARLQQIKQAYEATKRKVARLFEQAEKPVIFMPHNVPFNTSLDKITNRESPRYGYHFGSVIAREIVLEYDPVVCVGGHMHEHFGKCRLGNTTVINAGFGSNVNVLLEVKGKKIRKMQFYNGRS